jgi:hypothetical protein
MSNALVKVARQSDLNSEIFIDFTTKPNGVAPLVTDTGQSAAVRWTTGQNAPKIVGGKLVADAPLDALYASYYQLPFANNADGVRVGCEFTVAGNDAGATNSTVALWDHDFSNLAGNVPQARVHAVIVPGTSSWSFWVGDGAGHLVQVANGTFIAPAFDGVTRWRHDVHVDTERGVANMVLPDDSVVTVTAAQIAAASGFASAPTLAGLSAKYAMLEHFALTHGQPNLATFPQFTSFWAESSFSPRGRRTVSPAAMAKVIQAVKKTAAVSPTFTRYAPSSALVVAATTTQAAIDGTNVVISGVFGPTGTVLIDVMAWYEFTRGADTIYWQVYNGVTSVSQAEVAAVGLSGDKRYVHHKFVLTGTPAAPFTYNLRHQGAVGNADFKASSSAPFAPVVLEARPA